MTAADVYAAAFRRGLRPEPLLTVSEWADRHRVLSNAASAEPGRWRTDRTPYLRAIMDALSPGSPFERVVFMKGAQIGGTEAGNNWLGYIVHNTPAPTLAVAPTVEMAKRASKQRLDPLIDESPVLRALVAPARARDSGNTILQKEFPGGVLVLTGANSAVGLRSMPARFLFLDEVDAYPGDADGEGDPVSLAMARTATFGPRRKVLMVSTPTVAGRSRIEAAYAESDRRVYAVPCPHCGDRAPLTWARIRWTKGRPRDAWCACEACGGVIEEHHRGAMLAGGEWIATGPGDGRTAGFHLSALYSPPGWFSWADAAEQFDAASGDPARLKVFVNTVLGETWAERGEAPDWRRLYDRREDYRPGTVPAGGLVLTVGVDVQKDRIEAHAWAWGRGRTSWFVERRIFPGSPFTPEPWRGLREMISGTWPHACGAEVKPARVMIDAGFATTEVAAFVRTLPSSLVYAVKGSGAFNAPVLSAPKAIDAPSRHGSGRRGLKVWMVGDHVLKEELYGFLALDRPTDEERAAGAPFPPGYVHLSREADEAFCRQMVAEEWDAARGEWRKTGPNEALDGWKYARAGAAAVGVDRFTEGQWQALEHALDVEATPPGAPAPPTPGAVAAARRRVIRSPWMEWR